MKINFSVILNFIGLTLAQRTIKDERKRNYSKKMYSTQYFRKIEIFQEKNPILLSTNTLNEIENRLFIRVR